MTNGDRDEFMAQWRYLSAKTSSRHCCFCARTMLGTQRGPSNSVRAITFSGPAAAAALSPSYTFQPPSYYQKMPTMFTVYATTTKITMAEMFAAARTVTMVNSRGGHAPFRPLMTRGGIGDNTVAMDMTVEAHWNQEEDTTDRKTEKLPQQVVFCSDCPEDFPGEEIVGVPVVVVPTWHRTSHEEPACQL